MRSLLTLCAVAAICCGVAVPAQAGGGSGGGKSGGSKSSVSVQVKNVGTEPFGAAVQAGNQSTFPTNQSLYKALVDGGVGTFKVKQGTFTLFGVVDDGSGVFEPAIGPQTFTTSGKTTFIEADALEGLATKVTSF